MNTETETFGLPDYKIQVKSLTFSWGVISEDKGFALTLDTGDIYHPDIAVRRKAKQAFAVLRKAIKAYRHSSERFESIGGYRGYDYGHSESGSSWIIYKDVLLHFANWFVFPDNLDVLIDRAEMQRKAYLLKREQERAQRRAEDEAHWQQYFGSRSGSRASSGQRFTVDSALQLFELDRAATETTIKKQYRQLALKHHPDTGGSKEAFIRINAAYEVLLRWASNDAVFDLMAN